MRNSHPSTFRLGLELPFPQQVTLAEGVGTSYCLKKCRSGQVLPALRLAPNVPLVADP